MPLRTRVLAGISTLVLLAFTAAIAAWYFWPLLHESPVRPPPRGWTPAVTVLAGTGSDGRLDGTSVSAIFSEPFAMAALADGSVAIADAGFSHVIRRLAVGGQVTTIAGGGRGFRDGAARDARFATPSGIAVDASGTMYIADTGNHAIRRLSVDGVVSTVAGNGAGFQDGAPDAARFNGPIGLALDRAGALIVADSCNDRIRRVAPNGRVSTLAGDGVPGWLDGPAQSARFDTPAGITVTSSGSVVVADSGNDVLRRISPEGLVSTLPTVDAAGLPFGLMRPVAVAESSDGRLYVAERRGIVEIAADGQTRFLAGGIAGFADGPGPDARFRAPSGLVVMPDGGLIVADSGNRMLRQLQPPGLGIAVAPSSPRLAPGFDLGTFSALPILWPLDPQGGPHEVAGTVGEARGNPGGEGRERFHAGIDVRGDEGEPVLAVRDGTVDQVMATGNFGTLNEYVTVGPVTYVHIRVGRNRKDQPLENGIGVVRDPSGTPVRVRVARGWHVSTGEVIGTVNKFRHVHLSIGPSGEEANALDVGLPNFVDTVAPVIAPRGIQLSGLDGRPLTERQHGRLVVRAPVRIVVEAWDQVNGDAPTRRLGVYRLGYQLLTSTGVAVPGFEQPRVTISFDRLPSDPDAPHALYAPGSGIPFYRRGRTRFRYNVTTRLADGRVLDDPWDPAALPPGDYVLRILVADEAGNVAVAGRDVALRLP